MSTFLWKGQGGRSRALESRSHHHHPPTHTRIFITFLMYSSTSERTQGNLPNHNERNRLFFIFQKHTTTAAATNLRDPSRVCCYMVPLT